MKNLYLFDFAAILEDVDYLFGWHWIASSGYQVDVAAVSGGFGQVVRWERAAWIGERWLFTRSVFKSDARSR